MNASQPVNVSRVIAEDRALLRRIEEVLAVVCIAEVELHKAAAVASELPVDCPSFVEHLVDVYTLSVYSIMT